MTKLSLRFITLTSVFALAGCGDDDFIYPPTTQPLTPAPDAGADAGDAGSTPAEPADAALPEPEPTPDAGPSNATADAGDAAAPAAPTGSFAVGERPESAQFDAVTNAWYVSVQGETDVPGDGYIAKLDANASAFITERFVTGLNEPKGIRVHDGRLFVADVTELVIIDLASAEVLSRTSIIGIGPNVPAEPFLNDVAVRASTGYVYVSDNRNNMIYRFEPDGSAPLLLLSDPNLEAPNGLLVDERDPDDPRLLVASLGPGFDPVLGTSELPGAVLSLGIIDLNDGDAQAAVSLISQRIGNLDGIEISGDDLLVSDVIGGRLLRVTPTTSSPPAVGEGNAQVLRSGLSRGADLGFDPARGLVLVPETTTGVVTSITLE
ncbi:MAG: hypothetical protein ABW217_04245 [Polyangiaceae bacterium]